jgi:hypothetical protein
MKRFKSARQQDAEYRTYEWNPDRCYTCDTPFGGKMFVFKGGHKICLRCDRLVKSIGKGLKI